MIICEFCVHYQPDGKCGLGLNIPKRMGCGGFGPALDKFCSDPKDFVNPRQIIQMGAYFGIKGVELKKIKLMAEQEETSRSQAPAA